MNFVLALVLWLFLQDGRPATGVVAGQVLRNGQPAANTPIVAFLVPASGGIQLGPNVGSSMSDGQGNFRAAMPPGDYFVAAVTSLPNDWMAPEALEALTAHAQKVRVTPGAPAQISLTARAWGR